ncbi:uncharacterized protein CDV56_105494 [Aspergillus thermomutatus]|uniref:DUF7707 domain-containing protein n=1 Tax=Aspergillus thermomutatus TaxID=41047 RepID=A0A397HDE6_ASPTH|nr:uncharacterized protein CDV56_105494 [Aspergillus thermomutatus]RHZ61135.1 hypothetical protein CDV56_105494 [Aspergillus thermomutatus]
MIFSRALIVAASLVGLVSSQTWTAVNISAIDSATRSKWCLDQTSSCPLLCLQMANATGDPIQNDCDSDDLTYNCVCSNQMSPNASEYSQTIPYYLCTEANTECVDRCDSSDATCQSACRTERPCGAQNPKRHNVTTTTSATSNPTKNAATTTTLAAFTGEATNKNAAVRVSSVDIGHVYGLCVVLMWKAVEGTSVLFYNISNRSNDTHLTEKTNTADGFNMDTWEIYLGRSALSRLPSLMSLSYFVSSFYPVPSLPGASTLPLSLPVTLISQQST